MTSSLASTRQTSPRCFGRAEERATLSSPTSAQPPSLCLSRDTRRMRADPGMAQRSCRRAPPHLPVCPIRRTCMRYLRKVISQAGPVHPVHGIAWGCNSAPIASSPLPVPLPPPSPATEVPPQSHSAPHAHQRAPGAGGATAPAGPAADGCPILRDGAAGGAQVPHDRLGGRVCGEGAGVGPISGSFQTCQ